MPSSNGCDRARWHGMGPRPAVDPARSGPAAWGIPRPRPPARRPAARWRVLRRDRSAWAAIRRVRGASHRAPRIARPDQSAGGARRRSTRGSPPRPTHRSRPASPTTRRRGCGPSIHQSPWLAARGPWSRPHVPHRSPSHVSPAGLGRRAVRWASSLRWPGHNPGRLPPDRRADRSSRTTVRPPHSQPSRRPR